jgi:hypothetical protein
VPVNLGQGLPSRIAAEVPHIVEAELYDGLTPVIMTL